MSALVEPSQPSQYKFVSRVTSYPPISRVLETGKEYYNWGKETSSVVAYAESTVEGGMQWLAPKVEPLLETAKPLLVRADSFGCSALDTVETNAQKLRTNYEATREVLEQKVTNAKEVTYGAIEQVQQKYVAPVDEYLKDSLVARPYNIALDVTEKVVDRILPNEEGQKENEIAVRGPISKTAFLSKRIQQQAFLKLQNLSLRAPEKLNAMQYTVDLIKYAASSLDNGLVSLNQTLNKGLEAGTVAIKEAPKEVKEKIQTATQDALAALHTAVEVVAKQIPAEISTKFNQFKEATLAKGDESLSLFSQVAQSSSNLLHEASGTIGDYISRGETIPQQLLSSVYTTLHKVLDSLMSVAEPKILWSSDSAGSQKKED